VAGRKKQNINVVLLKGKTHLTKKQIEERKLQEKKLQPATDRVMPPEWLDEVAVEEWHRVVEELKALKLMTNLDVMALAIYCDSVSKFVQTTEKVKKNGLTYEYTTATGKRKAVSPEVTAQQQYANQIRAFCSEFGLTPSSRLRLVVPAKEEKPKTEEEEMFGDAL